MAVNTQKLLPGSKTSALAVRTSLIPSGKKQKGGSIVKSEGGGLAKEILQMKVKVLKLQGEFDKNKKLNQQEQDSKRKSEEKEKRSKREKNLEKRDGKGVNLPNVISKLPGGSIVDAIKRFLGFTFLGWLVGKYEVLMPKLEKFMSVAKPVFEGLVYATGSILKGVYGFVEAGYKAYDSVSAQIKAIGGEDAEKTFHNFSSHLNKLLNGTLMAAMLIASTSPGGKPGKPGRMPGGKPGRMPPGGSPKPNQRLQSYLGRNNQTKLIERRYGNDAARMYEARRAQGVSAQRALADVRGKFQPLSSPQGSLGGANRGSGVFKRGLAKAPQRAATKMFGKAAGKTVSKLGGRIPIVGPLIDFGIRTLIYKEPLGKAAAGAVGMGVGQALGGWLGGAIGGIVGSVVPFVGTMLVGAAGATIGSLIGGLIGDMIGAALYDFLAGSGDNKKPTKRASGGPIPPTRPQMRRRVKSSPKRNKVQAQKTSPGKDIGGRYKIEEFYGKEKVKPNDPTDTRTYGQEIVKKLEKSSQEVKKLPLDWVASIGGAFIDMTLGQRPDKKLASDVAKSFGSFVDTILNNQVTTSTGQISKALVGMAEGGSVPQNSDEKNQIAKRVETDIERRLQTIFDKASSETFKNLRPESVTKTVEELRQMQERSRQRQGGGGGGAPSPDYTDITKISMGGFSSDDIDALGRMIAAESGNQPKIGKAAVLSVILNRYRLAKAGDAGYMPPGKNKNNVTLKDILYDEGQFSPIRDGRFDKTSSAAGKNALADAIAFSGNDPKSFKEKLMKDLKMSEENAEMVVRATAFSNPKTRRSRPFDTPEVSVGDHSFQSSPYSKIGSFPGAISAKVEREAALINKNLSKKAKFLLVMAGSKGYRQVMPGESAPKDYLHHGHEDVRNGLLVRDYGITPQVHGGSTMLEGEGAPLVVPFGMKAKAIVKGRHEVQFQDKDGNVIAVYHHLENIPANINGKFISGGTFFGTQGGRPGASSGYGSSTAVHTHLEATAEWHNAFIKTYARGLDVTKTNLPEAPSITPSSSASKGDYDIIIPLDHVPAHLVNKIPDTKGGNTFKFASQTGADGREREYTGKIASYVSEKLKKQGYRVKIIAPEDFGNFQDYDNYITNQSKKGTTVLPFHLDADPRRGGTGFLARIRKDDIEDARVAESVAPVLKKYAEIFGSGQRFGGIDSVQNATIDRAAAGPAALLELGSLVTLEKMFGKNFVNHPQYTAFLDELTTSISQTVQKQKPAVRKGQVATLNNKPVTWDGKKWVPKEQYDNTQGWKAATKRSAQIQADRPWWDKLGFFGGAAAERKRKKDAEFLKNNPGTTLYRNKGGATISKNQPTSSYSSLNKSGTLKEDTSLNKEMVIMYQKEIVMA